MSPETEEAAPDPPRPQAGEGRRSRRSRVIWRVGVGVLAAVVLYALYGGSLGEPSPMRSVQGEFSRLRFPSVFGTAQVRRVGASYERIQIAGFGDEPARGPARAMEAALKLTRAGGLLFEVRGLASERERDYLLRLKPYSCETHADMDPLGEVAGIEIQRIRRGLLFRWLPSSVALCGTRIDGSVLSHASGFVAEGTWSREGSQLRTMLRDWAVARDSVPTEAHGCRLKVDHEPPLYVQFKSEALARAGLVSAQTVHWIDLPYQRDESVGRFSPQQLDEVASACAHEQARFAQLVESGADRHSPEAQEAHHAFMARCSPLYPTLAFLGAGELAPEALPRPLSGWTMTIGAAYAPAICLPLNEDES